MIKVLLDSSVIITVSIQKNTQSIGIPVDQSFEKSVDLFDFFKKHANKKIGITTKTICNELIDALPNAIDDHFQKYSPTMDKKELDDKTATIIDLCKNTIESLFSTLSLETPDNALLLESRNQVTKMSEDLKKLYESRSDTIKHDDKIKQNATVINNQTPSKESKIVSNTPTSQVDDEPDQLKRFMRNYPNSKDCEILAESIAIKRQIESSGQQVDFYIASADTGFFSPRRGPGGVKSDTVTKEIFTRFGITCDFPEEIRKQIPSSL